MHDRASEPRHTDEWEGHDHEVRFDGNSQYHYRQEQRDELEIGLLGRLTTYPGPPWRDSNSQHRPKRPKEQWGQPNDASCQRLACGDTRTVSLSTDDR